MLHLDPFKGGRFWPDAVCSSPVKPCHQRDVWVESEPAELISASHTAVRRLPGELSNHRLSMRAGRHC